MNIHPLRPGGADWSPDLAHASPPPKKLFLRGRMPAVPGIGVVGTRRISPYGRSCVDLLVPEIVRLGLPVISGLALGIDGAAHEAALQANGRTFAVIGSGVDDASIFPERHIGLAKRMLEADGGILSEYPPGMPSMPYHFPRRNRLIAALSRAVLVVEAPRKSGAMITAKLALDMGREVWAVPGPITQENSEGPNELIKNGATPITYPDDIAQALGCESGPKKSGGHQKSLLPFETLSPPERAVAEKLASAIDTADALARALGLSVTNVSGVLTSLEIRGMAISIGGGRYALKP